MYYAHFGLKQPPFKITPNTEFFFSGANRGAVLDALVYAISSGEGIVKVVGEVGSGKTMLCRMLEGMLPENIERVYLANPSVAPENILHAIAFELQLALPSDADHLQVMHALQNYLIERHAEGRQVVIFVEEAQGMPLATLEEIRLLSNLETRHDKLLQIVLFGQPELDTNLNEQHIRQLKERITHSFSLGPLNEKDIEDYLMSRLRTAGYFGPPLFTKNAVKRIVKASLGLVRRINILADKALLAAFAENVYAVTPKHINIAIKDSEFGAETVVSGRSKTVYWLALATLLIGSIIGFSIQKLLAPRGIAPMHKTATSQAAKPDTAPIKPQQQKIAPALPAPEPARSISAVQATTSLEPVDIIESRMQATKIWLAQQPAETVSIQLMASNDIAQLRTQLEKLTSIVELDRLHIYRTSAGNKPYLSVLYGEYPDRASASEALNELPKPLRAYRPQLRTVGGINDEIKLFQQ